MEVILAENFVRLRITITTNGLVVKHSSGEHNTYEVYMIHTNPCAGVYA